MNPNTGETAVIPAGKPLPPEMIPVSKRVYRRIQRQGTDKTLQSKHTLSNRRLRPRR